jgi:hypothetical protein
MEEAWKPFKKKTMFYRKSDRKGSPLVFYLWPPPPQPLRVANAFNSTDRATLNSSPTKPFKFLFRPYANKVLPLAAQVSSVTPSRHSASVKATLVTVTRFPYHKPSNIQYAPNDVHTREEQVNVS